MPEPMWGMKSEIARRGKRLKNAANDLPMGYSRFVRIMNGFDWKPVDFDALMRDLFRRWDAEAAGLAAFRSQIDANSLR